MVFNPEQVRYLEKLAGLRLEADERELLTDNLARIVSFVDQLTAIDTEGVAPCAHTQAIDSPRRPDVRQPSLPLREVLSPAADADNSFFQVPAIFGVGDEDKDEKGDA